MDEGVASKKDLERVGGLVSHCSYVVRGGRTFSRRIFDLAASYSRHCRSIPLDDAILADFHWWLSFCNTFNGKACIIRDMYPIPLYSDASFTGFGAWMGLNWIFGLWEGQSMIDHLDSRCDHLQPPPAFDTAQKNINVYELWPVVVGIKRWAPFFRNTRLHVVTDNMQVLAMLNTGRSSNKTCMTWLREVFWVCFVYNVDVHASYIRSADNILADAISRIAYHGVAAKCSSLLQDLNMCCSHLFRTSDVKDPTTTTEVKDAAWGASTTRARRSQINCYQNFCEDYHLQPFPCTASQAGIYASFLSGLMAPASISNYISALWAYQRSMGFEAYSSDYVLRLIMRGIRRTHSSSRPPRHPLSKQELLSMFDHLNTLLPDDLTFWAIVTLAFRALLRKCHYTNSIHNLRWRDLAVYPDHLVLVLPSSKTDQFGSKPLHIVLNASPGSPLCPVRWIHELARVHNPRESDFVFRLPRPGGFHAVPYTWFNEKLKLLGSTIG